MKNEIIPKKSETDGGTDGVEGEEVEVEGEVLSFLEEVFAGISRMGYTAPLGRPVSSTILVPLNRNIRIILGSKGDNGLRGKEEEAEEIRPKII